MDVFTEVPSEVNYGEGEYIQYITRIIIRETAPLVAVPANARCQVKEVQQSLVKLIKDISMCLFSVSCSVSVVQCELKMC